MLGLDYSLLEKNVACHGDETLLLFKSYDIPINTHYTDSDKKVASKLLELWTNFAKDGQPGQQWQRFEPCHGPIKGLCHGHRLEFMPDADVQMKPIDDRITQKWMDIYQNDPPRLRSLPLEFCTSFV